MKKLALAAILSLSVISMAQAQGTITYNNRIVGTVDVKINGTDGLPLDGTGYSVQLYVGAAGNTDPLAMSAATIFGSGAPVTSTFRTGAAAGYFTTLGDVAVDGVAIGSIASIQLRAWDNAGGTITSWDNALVRGWSNVYDSPGQFGGTPQVGLPITATSLAGLETFSLSVVPEPSVIALGALGLGMVLLRRRKAA